jgi:hypothetical protein
MPSGSLRWVLTVPIVLLALGVVALGIPAVRTWLAGVLLGAGIVIGFRIWRTLRPLMLANERRSARKPSGVLRPVTDESTEGSSAHGSPTSSARRAFPQKRGKRLERRRVREEEVFGYTECAHTFLNNQASILGDTESDAFWMALAEDPMRARADHKEAWALWSLDDPTIYRRYREHVPLRRVLTGCTACIYCGGRLAISQTDEQRDPRRVDGVLALPFWAVRALRLVVCDARDGSLGYEWGFGDLRAHLCGPPALRSARARDAAIPRA